MHRDHLHAELGALVDEEVVVLDHQVDIKGQGGFRAKLLDGDEAEGQVRRKSGVHDVEVQHLHADGLEAANGVLQVAHIRAHDRWCDFNDGFDALVNLRHDGGLGRGALQEALLQVANGKAELVFEFVVGVIAAELGAADFEIADEALNRQLVRASD